MAIPTYPTTLTNADWQKKKGLFAKMTVETGIGAALEKTHGIAKGINWHKMIPDNAYPNPQALLVAYKAAHDEYNTKVPKLIDQLVVVRSLTQTVAKKFQEKKLIPASAVKAVTDVGSACNSFIGELNKLENLTEFDNAADKYKKTMKVLVTAVNQAAEKIKSGLEELKKQPTVVTYGSHVLQPVRAYAAVVSRCPPLETYMGEWHTLSSVTAEKLSNTTVIPHAGKISVLFNKTQMALQQIK